MRKRSAHDNASRRPFGERSAVVFQLEQGRLLRLRSLPCLKLLAADQAPAGLSGGGETDQYSSGNSNVVTLRSASVMIQSVFSAKPSHGFPRLIGCAERMRLPS
jgi:hypothetical protein